MVEAENYVSFRFDLIEPEKAELFYHTKQEATYSGAPFVIRFVREPGFFLTYYIFPSLLFVGIGYCAFFIDKNAAPARVSLGIVAILINININSKAQSILPKISYRTWLGNFLLGTLLMSTIQMAEYAVLNYCTTTYNQYRNRINTIVSEIHEPKSESEAMKNLKVARNQAQAKTQAKTAGEDPPPQGM